jgi:hypothetical protein
MNRVGFNRKGGRIKTDAPKVSIDRGFVAHIVIAAVDAVLGSVAAVIAAVTSTAVDQVITTGLINPAVPRNVTATAGGTPTDIKAIQVTVTGTNFADEVITEILPAFTLDTAGTVTGNKAFKTITSVTIPAHDGLGATTSIGLGAKLGLPFKLEHNTVLYSFKDDALQGTAPTVATSLTALESNTFTLANALNAKKVDLYLVV